MGGITFLDIKILIGLIRLLIECGPSQKSYNEIHLRPCSSRILLVHCLISFLAANISKILCCRPKITRSISLIKVLSFTQLCWEPIIIMPCLVWQLTSELLLTLFRLLNFQGLHKRGIWDLYQLFLDQIELSVSESLKHCNLVRMRKCMESVQDL